MLRPRTASLAILAVGVASEFVVGLVPLSSTPRRADVDAIAAQAVAVDISSPYTPGACSFLKRAVREASIVQLGESIHVTAEFPRARVQLIRYLHEQMGFDVLALEGSLTQAWLAQEHLYRSRDPVDRRIEQAQRLGWFKLWNTVEMRELMAYVELSRRTPRPLYLTSFDVQTGASAEFGMGQSVLTSLVDGLESFGTPPPAVHATKNELVAALAPVVQCAIGDPAGLGSAGAPAASAIDAIQVWIDAITPAVTRERPAAHLAALRLIPDNLRDHVALCEHATSWQKTRDELNADNALQLREQVSAAHKIILWAHHSHVGYNASGARIPSMGQHIRERVGREVYSVGLFAGGGHFLDVAPLSVHRLPALNKVGVERMLDAVGRQSYFVDLLSLPTTDPSAGWLVPMSSRMEGRWTRSAVLARDFDGALYFRQVHPGTGMVPDGAFAVLRVFGFFVDHFIATALVVFANLVWLVMGLVRFVRASRPLSRRRNG